MLVYFLARTSAAGNTTILSAPLASSSFSVFPRTWLCFVYIPPQSTKGNSNCSSFSKKYRWHESIQIVILTWAIFVASRQWRWTYTSHVMSTFSFLGLRGAAATYLFTYRIFTKHVNIAFQPTHSSNSCNFHRTIRSESNSSLIHCCFLSLKTLIS